MEIAKISLEEKSGRPNCLQTRFNPLCVYRPSKIAINRPTASYVKYHLVTVGRISKRSTFSFIASATLLLLHIKLVYNLDSIFKMH